MSLEVEITRRDVNGRGTEGKVKAGDMAIVARKLGFAEWEPLYGEKRGEQVPLPHRFALNDASIRLLEEAAEKKGK